MRLRSFDKFSGRDGHTLSASRAGEPPYCSTSPSMRKLLEKLELLQDIHTGQDQIDGGQGITHRVAQKKALEQV